MDFDLSGKTYSPLFLARFEQSDFCGINLRNTSSKLGNGSLDLGLPRCIEVAVSITANGVSVTAQTVDGPPQFSSINMERSLQLSAGDCTFLSIMVFFQIFTQGLVDRCALHRDRGDAR